MPVDDVSHAINLINFDHRRLQIENRRLQIQLDAAKEMLLRMDADRLGLKKVVDHLRANWVPADANDQQEQAFKRSGQAYDNVLISTIRDVFADENYKKQREAKILTGIQKDIASELEKEKQRDRLLHEAYNAVPPMTK